MITCGIASVPQREASLQKVLESLYNQVDIIFLSLNGYKNIAKPLFLEKMTKVIVILNKSLLGAEMKFAMADRATDGYYVSWDDDIVPRDGLIRYMVEKCDKYHAICSLCGKRYDGETPIPSYRKSMTLNVHALKRWDADCMVDVGGSGAMVFRTAEFHISLQDFKYKNMADIQLSYQAWKQGVNIIALAHAESDLKYIKPPKGTTIWEQSVNDFRQTEILNSFIK